MSRIIAIANQKGGVGKTTTALNLGVGLSQEGRKVLIIDSDPQANCTQLLGWKNPDELQTTLFSYMSASIDGLPLPNGILHHNEEVDLLPSNIELSGMEISLVNAISRENILKRIVNEVKRDYDYVIIDTSPFMGLMTINALTCADDVIIPVQTHYLPAKGLQELTKTIEKVKRQLNPRLNVEGILFTFAENTNISKEVIDTIIHNFGEHYRIFESKIPKSVKAIEAGANGESIFKNNANNPVAFAYKNAVKEVIADVKGRNKANDTHER